MHTEEKHPNTLLVRVGGTLTGAMIGALSATVLFFIVAVLDVLPPGFSFQLFLGGMTFAGACFGMKFPRQALNSLWFFFPEICEKP